jgi:hypothetical protein
MDEDPPANGELKLARRVRAAILDVLDEPIDFDNPSQRATGVPPPGSVTSTDMRDITPLHFVGVHIFCRKFTFGRRSRIGNTEVQDL